MQVTAAAGDSSQAYSGSSLQAAALHGLVSTAKPVYVDNNSRFLEPVAKVGSGAVLAG